MRNGRKVSRDVTTFVQMKTKITKMSIKCLHLLQIYIYNDWSQNKSETLRDRQVKYYKMKVNQILQIYGVRVDNFEIRVFG